MSRRSIIFGTLLVACGTPPPAPKYSLSDAIAVQEITQTGEVLTLPAEGMAEVDVNSTLVLKMNDESIKGTLDRPPPPAPEVMDALTARLEQGRDLIQAQAAMVARLSEIGSKPDVSLEQLEEYGKVEAQMSERVVAFAQSGGDDEDVIYSEPGYQGVLRYLRSETDALLQEHQQLIGEVDRHQWRLKASLHSASGADPVHVINYDRLSAGPVNVHNKFIPVLDERARKQQALAAALAKERGSLDGVLKGLEAGAEAKLNELDRQLEALPEKLEQRVKRISVLGEQLNTAGELLEQLKTLTKDAPSTLRECRDALKSLNQARGAGLKAMIQLAPELSKDCVNGAKGLASTSKAARANAEKLLDDARNKEAAQKLSAELTGLMGEVTQLDPVQAFLGKSKAMLQGPKWAEEDAFEDQSVDKLVDGQINLTTRSRQPGDHLSYQGEVRDGKTNSVVLEGPLRTAKIVQNGLQTRVSGSLLFIQPTSIASNEAEFRAAPALTAGLHFRCSRQSGKATPDGLCRIWNVINPGIGIHTATVTLGELTTTSAGEKEAKTVGTPHLAAGGTLQLFGDLLQGGIGYDLQSARSYWFIGAGLQTLTDLGFTLEL